MAEVALKGSHQLTHRCGYHVSLGQHRCVFLIFSSSNIDFNFQMAWNACMLGKIHCSVLLHEIHSGNTLWVSICCLLVLVVMGDQKTCFQSTHEEFMPPLYLSQAGDRKTCSLCHEISSRKIQDKNFTGKGRKMPLSSLSPQGHLGAQGTHYGQR